MTAFIPKKATRVNPLSCETYLPFLYQNQLKHNQLAILNLILKLCPQKYLLK